MLLLHLLLLLLLLVVVVLPGRSQTCLRFRGKVRGTVLRSVHRTVGGAGRSKTLHTSAWKAPGAAPPIRLETSHRTIPALVRATIPGKSLSRATARSRALRVLRGSVRAAVRRTISGMIRASDRGVILETPLRTIHELVHVMSRRTIRRKARESVRATLHGKILPTIRGTVRATVRATTRAPVHAPVPRTNLGKIREADHSAVRGMTSRGTVREPVLRTTTTAMMTTRTRSTKMTTSATNYASGPSSPSLSQTLTTSYPLNPPQ